MGKVALRASLAVVAMVVAGLGSGRADPTDATMDAAATEEATTPQAADVVKAVMAAGAVEEGQAATQAARDAARRMRVSPLDRRVMLLTRELGLSASQQVQVRKVLESQREQVARVWSDTSIPAARRVSATQAVGDRTADRIRALLNGEQRKKYLQPRRRDAPVGTAGGDVESWMNASRRR